jgi:hypothetical protein
MVKALLDRGNSSPSSAKAFSYSAVREKFESLGALQR